MASLRKKHSHMDAAAAKEDAPILPQPQGSAAQLPPVADNLKPPEPIASEPSPVEQAALSAIKEHLAEQQPQSLDRRASPPDLSERLAQVERAEQLARQQAEPEPQQRAAPQIPARVQKWLADKLPYFRDAVGQAELNLATTKCVRDGIKWTDDNFIPTMERHLGMNGHKANGPVEDRPRPTPPPAAPARQQQVPVPRQAVPMSAPVTRDSPSMSTGRPIGRYGPLTQSELEVAQACGQTPQEYAEKRDQLRRQGLIGNGQQ
jgi:hypothetical protein